MVLYSQSYKLHLTEESSQLAADVSSVPQKFGVYSALFDYIMYSTLCTLHCSLPLYTVYDELFCLIVFPGVLKRTKKYKYTSVSLDSNKM